MQIKLGAVSALALASSASAFTLQNEVALRDGMTQANEFALRNMDEICVSTRPVPMCDQDYVVKSYQNKKFDFSCVSRNSAEGQRLKQQVESNQVIPEMMGKTVHIQGRVQVPTKCVAKSQISGQEQRRREVQQQHGNRVELIENGEQQFDQEYQWETEQDQLTHEEQYERYNQHRSQEEKQWQKMQTLFAQYPELTNKRLHQLIKLEQNNYKQVAEQLRQLVSQKQITSHLVSQIETTLPTYFTEVAKQLYNAMQEQQKQQHQQNNFQREQVEYGQEQKYRLDQLVGDYQQYKQLMSRVYVYIVKEALKLNQQAPRRLANAPELIRKIWEKTQSHELTKKQVQKVDEVVEEIQQLLEQDQTNQLMADELVSEQLKASQKQARRNLMRVIVTGLMMENNPVFEQRY